MSKLQQCASLAPTLARALDAGEVRAVYQPIIALDDGSLVAIEALARGPEGPLHLPGALFAAAAEEGLAVEFEWAFRAAALTGALAGPLPAGVSLFVNVESSLLGARPPAHIERLEDQARRRANVLLELTERDLVRRPADVLRAVVDARARGWGIALDDVGAHPASLALMPLVRPDVVKLDMGMVHGAQTVDVARVASAVASYAEESGASVLAEGVETELHEERAIALGATLAQGWRYGRPGPLPTVVGGRPHRRLPLLADERATAPGSTPFDLVGRRLRTRLGRKSQLLGMSRHLERQAGEQPVQPLLLAAFEDTSFFTPATARRYSAYADTCPLVAAFGTGLDEEPAPGVRGAALDPADPLVDEWTVVVLSPHFAAALIGRDLGDGRDAPDRRFEFALTHDRGHVTTAARSLVDRIAGRR